MSPVTRRQATEDKILRALRDQLADQGFRGLGVNAVARRADVSKELIYRYFGGMNDLIRELMRRQDYWSKGLDLTTADDGRAAKPPAEEAAEMLVNQLELLRAQPELQEIRRWELIDRNEITLDLATAREKASSAFLTRLGVEPGSDAAARLAVLLSGVLYLVLRSKTSPRWFGIDLDDDAGWRTVAEALQDLAPHIFDDEDATPGSAKPEEARSEALKPETVEANAAHSEAAQSEAAQPDAAQPEAGQSEDGGAAYSAGKARPRSAAGGSDR